MGDATAWRALVRPTLSFALTACAAALGYASAPPALVLSMVMLVAISAWFLDDRGDMLAYTALLGVETFIPGTGIQLPFRFAFSDLFILPIVARLASDCVSDRRRLPRTTLDGPLFGLLVVFAASTAIGVARTGRLLPYVLINKDLGILLLVAGFYGLTSAIRHDVDVAQVAEWFVAGAAVANLLALGAALVSVSAVPNRIFEVSTGRLYGWLLNPSSYGQFIATAALLAASGCGARLVLLRSRAVRATDLAFFLLAVVLTYSRSVWVALAAGAILMTGIRAAEVAPSPHFRLRLSASAALVLVPLILLGSIVVTQWPRIAPAVTATAARQHQLQLQTADECLARWEAASCDTLPAEVIADARERQRLGIHRPATDRDSAMLNVRGLVDRAALLKTAWRTYTATPGTIAFGIGLGSFYAESAREFGVPLIIHNTAAWFLIELGPAGLAVLVWFALTVARNAVGAMRTRALRRDLAIGICAALAAWATFSIFNEAFYMRHAWLLCVLSDRAYGFLGPDQRSPALTT